MVTDARLLACVQRVRVRCELFLGLLTQIQDDLAAMAQVGDPPVDAVIDSSGLFPFDGGDWQNIKALFQGLLTIGQDTTAQAVLNAAKVRPLDYILRTMPDRFYSSTYTGGDPYATILHSRLRPRALVIRALRYVLNDDKRVIGRVLSLPEIAALPDSETINENRNDVPPLTLGVVRGYYGIISQIIGGPIDSEDIAQSIDDACAGEELTLG
ncbi:MAG: hypothetical protein KatS3mg087_0100 [Patescibacteria group bacterium]|nr:MAG: hypothetical protein KatS3mg087_0100 [Patescibacteria group bacterium]